MPISLTGRSLVYTKEEHKIVLSHIPEPINGEEEIDFRNHIILLRYMKYICLCRSYVALEEE